MSIYLQILLVLVVWTILGILFKHFITSDRVWKMFGEKVVEESSMIVLGALLGPWTWVELFIDWLRYRKLKKQGKEK